METSCVKCRERLESGKTGYRGVCAACGSKMVKLARGKRQISPGPVEADLGA